MERERKFFCKTCHKRLDFSEVFSLPGTPYFQSEWGMVYPQEFFCHEHYSEYLGLDSEEEKAIADETLKEKKGLIILDPKKTTSKNEMIIEIGEKEFIFDNKDYKLFLEEFNNPKEYKLQIWKGYLVRLYIGSEKRKPIDFFHRWIMERVGRLQSFSDQNKIDVRQIHVHHKSKVKEDNRLINLECKIGKSHFEDHEKEEVFESFKKNFKEMIVDKEDLGNFKVHFFKWWGELRGEIEEREKKGKA